MAFVRKKGNYFYLVHSVRKKDGSIRHLTLAYLGKNAEITPQIRAQVENEFPHIAVDWQSLTGGQISMDVGRRESAAGGKKGSSAVSGVERKPATRKSENKRLPSKPEKWLEWD
jgi:hypothetical protein